MTFDEMRTIAARRVRPRDLTGHCRVASVSCCLWTDQGHLYTGVNIDTACGIGFCAEHAAIAQMVAGGEARILRLVAVGENGRIYPPCGRCRELMYQINYANLETEILVADRQVLPLRELLPHRWEDTGF